MFMECLSLIRIQLMLSVIRSENWGLSRQDVYVGNNGIW
jgi:hypothetical protein